MLFEVGKLIDQEQACYRRGVNTPKVPCFVQTFQMVSVNVSQEEYELLSVRIFRSCEIIDSYVCARDQRHVDDHVIQTISIVFKTGCMFWSSKINLFIGPIACHQ